MKHNIVPTLFAITVLGLALVPSARADGGCSLTSLSGVYAVSRQGTLVASVLGLPAPAPFGEVGSEDFNGAGTFSGKSVINIGGTFLNVTFTGTYTVDRDCTGSKTITTNVGAIVHEAIVVIGGGKRYIQTETDPFAVVQGTGERLED